jgi:hypothetical protein
VASTNSAGKLANTDCGCPINTFSSTDTPETTGCQPCPVNSYRKLVTTVVGESVDLVGTGVTACTCNPNYWWSAANNICFRCGPAAARRRVLRHSGRRGSSRERVGGLNAILVRPALLLQVPCWCHHRPAQAPGRRSGADRVRWVAQAAARCPAVL